MALIPIKYHNLNYPNEIIAKIEEVSGHFGKTKISNLLLENFSLHTEYSAKRRAFSEICINNFSSLVSMNNSNLNFGKVQNGQRILLILLYKFVMIKFLQLLKFIHLIEEE